MSDALILNAFYEELLNRPIDTSGLNTYTEALNDGATFDAIALDILGSPEYLGDLIQSWYNQYLDHPADAAAVTTFTGELQTSSEQTVLSTILGSQEFYTLAGGTNSDFVTKLYQDLLNRTPSPTEITPFVEELSEGATLPTVVGQILASPEYLDDQVNLWFETFLGRAPTPTELTLWTGELKDGTSPQGVIASLLSSTEFTDEASAGTASYTLTSGTVDGYSIGADFTLKIDSGATAENATIEGGALDVESGAAATGSIDFTAGVLQIDGATLPTDPNPVIGAAISGFNSGDTIDLTGISYTGGQPTLLAGNVLQVVENGGTYDIDLDSTQDFTGEFFHASSDGANGTDIIVNDTACYCRGTLIQTARGEVAVEALAVGDRAVTLSGAAKPVKWIGRRSYVGRFVADNPKALPVVILAGALEDEVPSRDLWVSPEHALYLDGVLIPARQLVNGLTVTQVEAVERVEYFHVELADHEVILANGAPAESFAECGNRRVFQNADDYVLRYPDEPASPQRFCAPRLEPDTPQLTAIRERLFDRAARLGHPVTSDPGLRLVVDGTVVQPKSIRSGKYIFALDRKAEEIWLASRSAVPAQINVWSSDQRRLGVCLRQIVLRDAQMRLRLSHGHPSFTDGYHADEGPRRWTDGMARLPRQFLDVFAGGLVIEVALLCSELRYPVALPPVLIGRNTEQHGAIRRLP